MKASGQSEPGEPGQIGFYGLRTGSVRVHRALGGLSFSTIQFALGLLLAVFFNLVTSWAWPFLTAAWQSFFVFWLSKLALPGAIAGQVVGPLALGLPLPHMELPTIAPDLLSWRAGVGITILVFAISPLIPERAIPWRYLLRVVAFVQAIALIYLATSPITFGYSTSDYIDILLCNGAWFMFLIPWAHALIYYVFEFSFLRKLAFTTISLIFTAVAIPFQVVVHGYLLVKLSTLVMPVLYLFFGTWLLLFVHIGLYGWAMSWRRVDKRISGRIAGGAGP
jgi:hypothetical protein